MVFSLSRARAFLAAGIGVGCVGAGLVLAFRLVTPELVGSLRTAELLALLGLLGLPLLMLWALAADRRFAAQHAAPAPRPLPLAAIVEPKLPARIAGRDDHPAPDAPAPTTHAPAAASAPGRRTPHHRRQEPAETRRDPARSGR